MNAVLFEHKLPTGQLVRVIQADITSESVDAIVNAANEHLQHGGGVAGAIRRKGGETIQQESNDWVRRHGPVETGRAAITGAGNLPARFVIHAVGPVWGSGNESERLGSAVSSALALADSQGLISVSMPGISSGIFGGPKDVCARVIVQAVLEYWRQQPSSGIKEVRFCNIDDLTSAAFVQAAKTLLSSKT